MVKDVFPLPGAVKNFTFPLLPNCPTCKSSSSGKAGNPKAFLSVEAVVGLELLTTTFTEKPMATELPNYVLVRFENHVTYITKVNPNTLFAPSPPH